MVVAYISSVSDKKGGSTLWS